MIALMRIAFAGTHRTGKSTLIAAVSSALPAYEVIDEPYRVLEEEGYELSDPPSVEDYERQLRRSIEMVSASSADTLFDRCPVDLVAYLQETDGELDVEDYVDEIRPSMETLDLIVVLSIEEPDRIAIPAHEDKRFRRRVDERMRTLLLDDPYGFGTPTLEIVGALGDRVRQVLRAIMPAADGTTGT